MPKFNTTTDLINYLDQAAADFDDGKITTGQLRSKTLVAREIVNVLKTEIAACALGKQFSSVKLRSAAAPQIEGRVA